MFSKSVVLAALLAAAWASPFLESRQATDLDSFVALQKNISLTGAVANIGGTNDSVVGDGPAPGAVVASPSTVNPDYFFTWTRDSALTLLMLTDELIFGTQSVGNNSLQLVIEYYTGESAVVQTVTNPVGTFWPAGQNLGEAKFYTNLTRYTGTWGRPQNDGPALRASTFMEVAEAIYQRNPMAPTIVKQVYWPLILNDLKYVGQYWNTSGYDLWEEVHGNSFFTTTAQFKSLIQGAEWAARLNETCEPCEQASQILCFLQSNFWNETGNYITANINANQVNRSEINIDPILAAMHVFDINATCDAAALQPCNSKVLATHKVVVDAFRNLYPINENATAPAAVAVGRYPEDTYYDGNPWYITTLACAEVLYDAVAQMTAAGYYVVDEISLPFFQDLYPGAQPNTEYAGGALGDITDAITTYADGFVEVVRNHLPANGSLSEQFNKTTGEPTSASALTWSFAAFVTMAERRSGMYPPSWGANTTAANTANSTCVWSSTNSTFTYTPAVAAGAPQEPQTYTNTSGCLVEVLITVNASTMFGQNVYLAGNASILNETSLTNDNSIVWPLLTGNITSAVPEWYSDLWYYAGETVEYQFALQGSAGNFTRENMTRTFTAPSCGSDRLLVADAVTFVLPTS